MFIDTYSLPIYLTDEYILYQPSTGKIKMKTKTIPCAGITFEMKKIKTFTYHSKNFVEFQEKYSPVIDFIFLRNGTSACPVISLH